MKTFTSLLLLCLLLPLAYAESWNFEDICFAGDVISNDGSRITVRYECSCQKK
jgi:hypothetical protein